jgi:RNA binding exosome subunit
MDQETVIDHFGRPCQFTEAKNLFSDVLEQAQKKEYRELKGSVGCSLLVLSGRIQNAHSASKSILEISGRLDDEDIEALLAMQSEYQCETANLFHKFCGAVLACVESGAPKEDQ